MATATPTFIFKSVVFKCARCLWLTIRGHFEKGTREMSYHRLGLAFWRADTHRCWVVVLFFDCAFLDSLRSVDLTMAADKVGVLRRCDLNNGRFGAIVSIIENDSG
jgi:hypothetical protein